MNLRQAGASAEIDERLAALLTNANAVRAITAAVEGTIGPKGLDTMLVDRFGEVVITNDGVTILDKMDVNHPAAKMLINIAKAQQAEVGDGTTTATIMAGSLVAEGVGQVMRGVPVARVIEGIKYGVTKALEEITVRGEAVSLADPALFNVAKIAGREHEDIARLVLEAAQLIGAAKLTENNFKLSDIIIAEPGADNEVFLGVIINQERMSLEMPEKIEEVKLLLIDDALEPEEFEDEALGTEIGFRRYMDVQDEFKTNVQNLLNLKINVVMTDRGVHDIAEEILTDAGVMVVQRVSNKDLRRVADHTGARLIKRSGIKKEAVEIEKYLGKAQIIYQDEKLEHIRVLGGSGKPMATILVGAATEEVVDERERIAKDAASSVQAAIKGGVIPGGGAIEIALARELGKHRENLRGMAAYGLDALITALKKPLFQMVENAGFNPLEKVEEVITAQTASGKDSLGVDCDTGEIVNILERGIVDPAPVKFHAIKAAGEVAVAILRIDTIIKKKEEGHTAPKQAGLPPDASMPDF